MGITPEVTDDRSTRSTPRIILASSSPRRQELIRTLGLPVIIRPANVDEQVDGSLSPAGIVETLSLRKALAVAQASTPDDSGVPGTDGSGAFRDIVVGSDTIVVLDGMVLGKPSGPEEAVRMLASMQGKTHEVYTGLACLDLGRPELGTWKQSRLGQSLSEMAQLEDAGFALMEAAPPVEKMGDTGRWRTWADPASSPGLTAAAVGHTVSRVTFRPMERREIEAYVRTGEPLDKAGAYGVQGIGAVFIEKIEGDFFSVMGLPLNLLYLMLARFGIDPFRT